MLPGILWAGVFAGGVAAIAVHADDTDTLQLPTVAAPGRRNDVDSGLVYRRDAEALRRFATLADALASIPGFRVRAEDGLGGYSELSFRGARAADVDVYIDGIHLNQDGDPAPDLSKWPLLWFSSLEARTGLDPQGSSPGSLARIDLSTQSAPGTHAEAEARQGSFSTAEAAASAQGGVDWKWNVGLEGQFSRNDYPFLSDHGTVYNPADDGVVILNNNGYWSRGLRAGAAKNTPESAQTLSLLWLEYRKQYPGADLDSWQTAGGNASNSQAYTVRDEWLAAWRWRNFGNAARWEAGLQAQRFTDTYRDPGQSLGYLSFEEGREGSAVESEGRYGKTLGPLDVQSDARLDFENQDPTVTPFSQPLPAPSARRFEGQFGSSLRARLARPLILSAEARISAIRFDADNVRLFPTDSAQNPERFLDPFALRGGLQWNTGAGDFGWLARWEKHAPSTAEYLGDNNGIKLDAGLGPETITSYSLTHAWKNTALNFQSSLFWNRYADPIRLEPYGASQFLRYANGPDYEAAGFENESRAETHNLQATVSLTLQKIGIVQGPSQGDWPAYQSPVEGHAEFYGKSGGFEFGPACDFLGPYYSGDANAVGGTHQDAHWEAALHAGAQRGRASLAVDVRNLFNYQARDFVYSPRSGRRYSLIASIHW